MPLPAPTDELKELSISGAWEPKIVPGMISRALRKASISLKDNLSMKGSELEADAGMPRFDDRLGGDGEKETVEEAENAAADREAGMVEGTGPKNGEGLLRWADGEKERVNHRRVPRREMEDRKRPGLQSERTFDPTSEPRSPEGLHEWA